MSADLVAMLTALAHDLCPELPAGTPTAELFAYAYDAAAPTTDQES
jgi:hypothetical protein